MNLVNYSVDNRIQVKKHTTEGVLSYDIDNAYPQRVDNWINSSARGTLCVNTYAKFIIGKGFVDKRLYNTIINRKGLTVDGLLRITAQQYARFRGFAWHVNYNLLGQITEITPLAFKNIRYECDKELNLTGRLAYYTDWGREISRSIDKNKIIYYDAYNPKSVLAMTSEGLQVFKGQILYYTGLTSNYPLASCDAVIEDLISDSQSKIFRLNNISTSFMASHAVITDKMEDEERENFAEDIKAFQGASNAGKVIHIEKSNPQSAIEIKKIDVQNVDSLFSTTEASVKDNIRGVYTIPPVLIGDLVAGKLGTASEIADATDFYNNITEDERIMMEEIFSNVLQLYKDQIDLTLVKIDKLRTKRNVQVDILKDLTQNERRALEGYEEIDNSGDKKLLAESLGVGGTQSLISVVNDLVMTPEQKKQVLIIVFGLSEEEANKIINGTV